MFVQFTDKDDRGNTFDINTDHIVCIKHNYSPCRGAEACKGGAEDVFVVQLVNGTEIEVDADGYDRISYAMGRTG